WLKFQLRTNAETLVMEIPKQPDVKAGISIDTGCNCGVSLSSQRWRQWNADHPDASKTLAAYYMPATGFVVTEQAWAKKLSFGTLTITEVPIREANPSEVAHGSPAFEASFGLAALNRLALIVDGGRGVAYLKPVKSRPPPYEHNRTGA